VTVQVLLNMIVGLVWMLLHDRWDFQTFSIGYFVGFLIIFAMRRFFPAPFYGRKLWAVVKLIGLFVWELILSTLVVVKQVTRPKLNIEPGVFKLETRLKSDWEIALLSMLITLTPGSVVMETAPEEGTLYIHAMDAAEFRTGILKTKTRFENAILEVTG